MDKITLKTLLELYEAGLIEYFAFHVNRGHAYLIGEHSKDGTLGTVTPLEELINKLNQTKGRK